MELALDFFRSGSSVSCHGGKALQTQALRGDLGEEKILTNTYEGVSLKTFTGFHGNWKRVLYIILLGENFLVSFTFSFKTRI